MKKLLMILLFPILLQAQGLTYNLFGTSYSKWLLDNGSIYLEAFRTLPNYIDPDSTFLVVKDYDTRKYRPIVASAFLSKGVVDTSQYYFSPGFAITDTVYNNTFFKWDSTNQKLVALNSKTNAGKYLRFASDGSGISFVSGLSASDSVAYADTAGYVVLNLDQISDGTTYKRMTGGDYTNWYSSFYLSQENYDTLSVHRGVINTALSTISTHTTSISQNASQIALRAYSSVVDAMDTRLTTAESGISVNAGNISLHSSYISGLSDSTLALRSSINLNAGAIALKASQTEVSSIDGRLTTAEGSLTTQAGQISAISSSVSTLQDTTVNLRSSIVVNANGISSISTNLTAIGDSVSYHRTAINQNASSITLKASATAVNAIDTRLGIAEGTISTHTSTIGGLESAIILKANVTALDSLTGRVGTAESGISTNASNIGGLTSSLTLYAKKDSVMSYISITPDMITINGTTTFATGYDPSTKTTSSEVTTIVGNTITTGYVNALSITALGAVTSGSIDASLATITNINASNISSGTLNTNRLNVAGIITAINSEGTTTINGGKLTTGTVTADSVISTWVYAGNLMASQISSGTINTDRLSASGIISAINSEGATTISGGKITTGSITASHLNVSTLSSISANIGTITAGSIDASTVSISNLNASNISSGTLSTNRLNVANVITAINSEGTTTISGSKITTGTVTTSHLNFTPVQGSNVIASINASAEGITIDASKLTLTGVLQVGTAANDINTGSTTISGGKITAGTITSLGAVTAGSFNIGSGKFQVASDGTLTATGANISGTVTASAVVSGISLNSPVLSSGYLTFSTGGTIGMGAGSGEIAISATALTVTASGGVYLPTIREGSWQASTIGVAYGGTGANSVDGVKANLGLVVGTHVQAYDADLTTYAGITPSANVQTLLGSATNSAIRSNIGLGSTVNTSIITGYEVRDAGGTIQTRSISYTITNGQISSSTPTYGTWADIPAI